MTYAGQPHLPFVALTPLNLEMPRLRKRLEDTRRQFLLRSLPIPVLIQKMGPTPCLERALPCGVAGGQGRPKHYIARFPHLFGCPRKRGCATCNAIIQPEG